MFYYSICAHLFFTKQTQKYNFQAVFHKNAIYRGKKLNSDFKAFPYFHFDRQHVNVEEPNFFKTFIIKAFIHIV
jgi:hypothetical protein